jgi:hypothetical protein
MKATKVNAGASLSATQGKTKKPKMMMGGMAKKKPMYSKGGMAKKK